MFTGRPNEKLFAIELMENGIQKYGLEPREVMDICLICTAFLSVAFRRDDLTKIELRDLLTERFQGHFDHAFESKEGQDAFDDVKEYLKARDNQG
jgi:hypothetical protein